MNVISMIDTDTWIYVYVWWCIYWTETNEYVLMCMNIVSTNMLEFNRITWSIDTDKYDMIIWILDITELVVELSWIVKVGEPDMICIYMDYDERA